MAKKVKFNDESFFIDEVLDVIKSRRKEKKNKKKVFKS